LVGGLAVSVRTEPRFTRDVDLVVAISDDHAAEAGPPSEATVDRSLRYDKRNVSASALA
jgi:hypothetical protein